MNKQLFGINSRGEQASLYTLKNENGMILTLTDMGAAIHAAIVPDKDGNPVDVILGYDDAKGYESPNTTYFGATVGRNINRIKDGVFTLNGVTYQLDKNNNQNNLHSGFDSYHLRVWNVKEATEDAITFSLHSPDGDQGFPGNADIEVTYTLTEDNAIKIEYHAVADADTVFNISNHSAFNMDGHAGGSVEPQWMWLDADAYTVVDAELIATGEIASVEGTPMDFREKKQIGRDIEADYDALHYGGGYDHNWVLNNKGTFQKVAEITSDVSGITMEVYTDLPGIQVYCGNFLKDEKGKDGVFYQKRGGICFETQYFPNAVNQPHFPSPIYKAGEAFQSTTMYKFKKSID